MEWEDLQWYMSVEAAYFWCISDFQPYCSQLEPQDKTKTLDTVQQCVVKEEYIFNMRGETVTGKDSAA